MTVPLRATVSLLFVLGAMSMAGTATASDSSLRSTTTKYAKAIDDSKRLLLLTSNRKDWAGFASWAKTFQTVMLGYQGRFKRDHATTPNGRKARLLLIRSATLEWLAMQQEVLFGSAMLSGDSTTTTTSLGYYIADDTEALKVLRQARALLVR